MIDAKVMLKALCFAAGLGYATSWVAAQEAAPEAEAPAGDAAVIEDPPEILSADPAVLLEQLAAEADPVEAGRLAREVLERWSHSGSDAMDLLLARGAAAVEAEDWPRAIAHLTALTDHAPEFAEGWAKRAEAFFRMGEYGAAMADLEQVLILEPRHFEALAGLGLILVELGEEEAALRAFHRAQEIYPAEENVAGAVERLEIQTGGRTL